MSKVEKLKNVEFLRFIFSIGIVFFHLVRWLGFDFTSNISLYKFLYINNWAGICVEFFFIIAGFFLLIATNFNLSFLDFVKKKILRLWPVLVFAVLSFDILSFVTPLQSLKYENIYIILLMSNIGFLKNTNGDIGPAWFVSSLFWVLLFYFYLIKYVSKIWITFCISILTILSFAFLTHVNMRYAFHNVYYIFNIGIMRAVACIGLGYLFGVVFTQYKQNIFSCFKHGYKALIYTCFEVYLFLFLIYHLFFHRVNCQNIYMIYIFAFSGLFWLFILKRGYFSRLLNNDFSVILGRYSYSIFIMHTIVLDLFKVYLWQQHKNFIIAYPVLNLILPVVASILLGILTYHLVEKPAAEFLKKKWFFKAECKNSENPLSEPIFANRGGGSLWILNPI